MIEILLIFLLIFLLTIGFYLLSKKTLLAFNLKNGSGWSLLIYRELIFIFLPLLLVNYYSVSKFSDVLLYAKDVDVFWISIISVLSILFFLLTLVILGNILLPNIKLNEKKIAALNIKIKIFAKSFVICGLTLLIFSMCFLNYHHALLESIINNSSLLQIRLDNKYNSNLPSQIQYLITLSYITISVYSGIVFSQNKYLKSILYLIISFFLATSAGDKAPAMFSIMIFFLSYSYVKGVNVSITKILFSIAIYLPSIYILLFYIVSLQISNLTIEEFNIYLVERLGIGQMSGVFETFSIPEINGNFYLHTIPFAKFFFDYIPYDKALMMFTEGYAFNEMGVKNSMFISEAYGMGGWIMLVLSPFIVGFSFVIGLKIMFTYISIFFSKDVAIIYTLPLYISSSSITGGFSSFPLFKGLIMNLILLTSIWIIYKIILFTSNLRNTI